MANPAAMQALTELRKREMGKYMETMQAKMRAAAAAQSAQSSSTPAAKKEEQKEPATRSKSKKRVPPKKEEDKKEDKDTYLDLLDTTHLDTHDSAPLPSEEYGFERFNRIPIGTFWQSQRLQRSRPRNLSGLRKVKKTKGLDTTLLEHGGSPALKPTQDVPPPTCSESPVVEFSIDDILSLNY